MATKEKPDHDDHILLHNLYLKSDVFFKLASVSDD